MARRKKGGGGGAGEGAYWMDTYGDMVTLLLAFFVLLFSFSTIDAVKWEALVGVLTGTGTSILPVMSTETAVAAPIELEYNTAPHDQMEPYSSAEDKDLSNLQGQAARELEAFIALVESVENFIEGNNLYVDLFTDYETYTIIARFGENIFFDSGYADIRTEAYELLDGMGALLAAHMESLTMVSIEGHTDNVPISNARFSDNWDLSCARATNTLRYIARNEEIDNTKMSTAGYGEYQPVESNDTEEGRAANRRVDFVIQAHKTV